MEQVVKKLKISEEESLPIDEVEEEKEEEDRRRRRRRREEKKRAAAEEAEQVALIKRRARRDRVIASPSLAHRIFRASGVTADDVVLDVLPAFGHTIRLLLPAAKSVIAIEPISLSLTEFQGTDSFTLVKVRPENCDLSFHFDVCVAVIDTIRSGPFLHRLLSRSLRPPAFRRAVVLFHESFAKRLTAKAAEDLYGRLSVNAQLLAEFCTVNKFWGRRFFHQPCVTNDFRMWMVQIEPKTDPPPPPVDFEQWHALTTLCFIRNSKYRTLSQIFLDFLRCTNQKHSPKENLKKKKTKEICEEEEKDDEFYLGRMFYDQSLDIDEMRKHDYEDDGIVISMDHVASGSALLEERVLGVLCEGDLEDRRPLDMTHEHFHGLLTAFDRASIRLGFAA